MRGGFMSREAGDDGSEEEKESFASDGESHDIQIPYLGISANYPNFSVVLTVLLWVLLGSFQGLSVCWIVLMWKFFSQAPSYITWLLNISIGLCGTIEIIFNCSVTAFAVIQLFQRGSYRFVHRCRVIVRKGQRANPPQGAVVGINGSFLILWFAVLMGAFLSHLFVFFALSFVVRFNFFGRMEKEMRRELNAYTNQAQFLHHPPALDELWEMAQEKYSCCGFGEASDYIQFPPSCCSSREVKCDVGNRWKRNCVTAEGEVGTYFINFGTTLIGTSIPVALLVYLGFRYFRRYWKLSPLKPSQPVDEEELEEEEEEEEDEDDEEDEEEEEDDEAVKVPAVPVPPPTKMKSKSWGYLPIGALRRLFSHKS